MRAKYDKNAFSSISPDLLCHRADPSTLVRGRPHTASLIDDLTDSEEIFLAKPSKENMSQMHDFGNFWCDLG